MIKPISYLFLILVVNFALWSCGSAEEQHLTKVPQIDSTALSEYLVELSSDKYMGRKPVSKGEELTINFLKNEFQKMGYQPGNGDSYFQQVPLVEITSDPADQFTFKGGKQSVTLDFKKDIVVHSERVQEKNEIENSELIFCGFGIVAPEYGRNDYEGIDMKGKTAVVFVNDPGYYSKDSTDFKGNTMTYYGRWTYKYEEAARQGADGVLIIHETGAAGYPWFVIQSSWTGGQQGLQSPDDGASKCKMAGWITNTAAGELFKNSKAREFKNLIDIARQPDFKPIPLGMSYSTTIENSFKKEMSNNVIALLPGTEKPDEYLIYTAHWDHLGVGQVVEGDSIYNGALDNASGTATVLAIAKSFAETQPKRSVVFLMVTAEEQGLLGSKYYAENPIFPLNKTIANLNKDGANIIGRTKDLTITGYGQSELDDIAKEVASAQGRYLMGDPVPEKGYFFRSDHFEFAKVGVPAFYAEGSYEHREKGVAYAKQKADEYTSVNYHQPSDEYSDDWDLSGAVEDAQLYLEMGLKIANEDIYPEWKEGSEFKNKRKLLN